MNSPTNNGFASPRSYFIRSTAEAPQKGRDLSEGEEEEYVPASKLDPSVKRVVVERDAAAERGIRLRELQSCSKAVHKISQWEQACFKHIFRGAFESGIDAQEMRSLVVLLFSALLNLVVVALNVFGNTSLPEYGTGKVGARFVFISEFCIVNLLFLAMIGTIAEAIFKKNVTTDTAIDTIELGNYMSEFSALQAVSIVQPQLMTGKIVPLFTEAREVFDVVKAMAVLIFWAFGCALAVLAVVMKVSQVGFVAKVPLEDWNFTQALQVLGLVLNLSKVDTSYAAERSTLLRALHKHFIAPGGPDSPCEKDEGVFSKFLQYLGVQRADTYEFFEAIFNAHFGESDEEFDSLGGQILKAANFGAFVLLLNNRNLSQYLQMIESPLPFYALGRKQFEDAKRKNHVLALEMCLEQSDPLSEDVFDMHEKQPDAFKLTFSCAGCDEDSDGDEITWEES